MDKKVPEDPSLTSRLRSASGDLKQLEQDIKTGMVDVRVLVEFREAMNHARHTAFAVEKWMHEEKKVGGNPYSVVQMVVTERMRVITELTHDLINDLDSGDLDYETQGTGELYTLVKSLEERLARIVKH
jgi:hypothetical protein